ncbi:AsmA family protein [Sneathiella sp.]|uniref:AsmA family protein n=1 Tax=Sneathiella sp. TaxID=1964365 RepID=UPI003564746B
MKKAIIAIAVLLVIIVAVVIALPFVIPTERVKQELISATNDATGRQLTINGDLGLSFFPTLGLSTSNVSFSNADKAQNPEMVTVDSMVIKLDLLPLLSGNVQVDEFVLTKPVIHLEVDDLGKGNWVFENANPDKAKKTEEKAESSGGVNLGISDLNLGDVRVVDGTVSFTNKKAGTNIVLNDVNLQLSLLGLNQPFDAKGSAVWNNEETELEINVGSPQAVLDNKETTTTVNISSKNLNVTYGGTINSLEPLALGGDTVIDIPSVRELAAWVGTPLKAEGSGFSPLKISGKVGAKGPKYSFTNASIGFDKISGVGDVTIDVGGKVPDIVGQLALKTLDLNPYLPASKEEGDGETKQPEAKKTGEKWDTTPIDLAGLKSVNAKFDLSVEEILAQKIKIGRSALQATLKNGVLDLALNELNLYEGTGKGTIHVDAQNPALKITNNLTIENIQLKPLLTDASDFTKLEGKGMFQADLTTTGKSQADLVSALNGNGQILFEDGSISGINLAAMARNLASAFTESKEAQKTDFAEISGTFTIKNGILTNDDLKLLNPFIRLNGAGTVQLPPKTLNYRIEPKLVATTKGQGGETESGVAVPIVVSGPWDNLTYAPDLAGALKNVANPEGVKKLLEGVKGSGDGAKGTLKDLKEGDKGAVRGLLDSAGSLFKKKN